MRFEEAEIALSSSGFRPKELCARIPVVNKICNKDLPPLWHGSCLSRHPCRWGRARLGHLTAACRPLWGPRPCCVSGFPLFLQPEDFSWMLHCCQSASRFLAISLTAVISKLAGEAKQRRIKASFQPLGHGCKRWCSGLF